MRRTRQSAIWQTAMARFRERQNAKRQVARVVISKGGSYQEAARKSGLSESTVRQHFPRRDFDLNLVHGHTFQDEKHHLWVDYFYLAKEYHISSNQVGNLVRNKRIRTQSRTTDAPSRRIYVLAEEFRRVYVDPKQAMRAQTRELVQDILNRVNTHLSVTKFANVTEFQMAVYIALALWKQKTLGHNPTRLQILEALHLRRNQLMRVGNALRALEEKGHIQRMPLRSQRGHFLYIITTPRNLAPKALTVLLAPKSGEEVDVPWYKPTDKGTAL